MYEVTIKLAGFRGVTKHLYRSESGAQIAVDRAQSVNGVRASYKKLEA